MYWMRRPVVLSLKPVPVREPAATREPASS
jgi:hypothetical protein